MIMKFRAWDTFEKKMCKVGQLTLDKLASWSFEPCVRSKTIGVSVGLQPHIKIMQSTGLHDINGKEIFEGDIVRPVSFVRWRGCVEYLPDRAAFIINEHNNDYLRGSSVFLSQFSDGLKVLGNVYEDPELLGEISKEK